MPVMRCDTPRQGQLWMHHEEIATTSDFCDKGTSKGRSKPRSLNLDEEHLSALQMEDPGSTSNNNNNNNKIRVHFNERLQVNAICDKLKNNAGFEMDGLSEDEDCASSSSFDSGGGNDVMGLSSICDDMGSCDNDGVGNDEEDGDDDAGSYVEMDGDAYGRQVATSMTGQNGPDCDADELEEDTVDEDMDVLEREEDSDEQALCIDTKDGANEVEEEDYRLPMDPKEEILPSSVVVEQRSSPVDGKMNNHQIKNDPAERRNKRKNFKPRNIVYQNYDAGEEAQSEFLEEYHLGNNWDRRRQRLDSHSPSPTKETETAKSPALSVSPPLGNLEATWRRCRTQHAEQPLDLSDAASVVSRTRASPSPPRRETTAGAPMDLTMSRGGGAADKGAICDAMDLSKGQVQNSTSSSNAGAEAPNYASNSAGLTTAAAAYQQLLATAGHHPLAPLSGLTGISASLLGLPSASHSSASVRAARAAAAAHAAAMGLVQAVRDCEEGHEGGGPMPTAVDASTMKDYAESTMKELLGLYGINDMAESITKDVPLPNFSSVKILENMSTPLAMLSHMPPTSSPKSHPGIPSPVLTTASAALPPMHSTPHTSSFSRLSTTVTPSSASTSASMATSRSSEQLYESFQSQMVDNVNKLANLPPNNIIGNPRVILPHNMSTILTLAAMQKTKGHGAPSASHSPISSSFGRGKHQSLDPSMAQLLTPRSHGLSTSLYKEGKSSPVDYSRYVKRYSSSNECGHNSCKDLNYREHFHCLDCNSRVFVKKEEMIRHFKWHKKRDESLQHGFLRYSPMDDCSEKFPGCSHNRKQTHYHCLKDSCEKVYISTSDVQMHANYHRKDSAIIQEGFQRFRATEDCATPYCAFSGQRTTHFHCRRATCNFTFKNKADMEKHKSYHIKDEQLNKDGFKKFMKHEHCSFENCRFSRVCNHIHCIRPGCVYVLHSSGQLYSHKRKHERRENEMAYRKFKLAQSMMRTLGENQVLALQSIGDELKASEYASQLQGGMPMMTSPTGGLPGSLGPSSVHGLTPVPANSMSFSDAVQQSLSKYTSAFLAAGGSPHLDQAFAAHGFVPGPEHMSVFDLSADLLKARLDDSWKKYLSRYTANDPCKPNCDFLYKDHYHCNAENCTMVFRSKDGVREHARNHEQQDQVTDAFYTTVDAGQTNCCPSDCPHQSKERHYHCGWQSCREIILPSDKPFRRLDHYKMHEYSHKLNFSKEYSSDPLAFHLSSSLDGIFKRKRGRPPKNRIIEFPVTSGSSDVPQAIYTSFKLPKPNSLPSVSLFDKLSSAGCTATSTSPTVTKPSLPPELALASAGLLTQNIPQQKVEVQDGFYVYPEGTPCSTPVCSMFGKNHYHCAQPRCFFITERSDVLVLHSKDFHDNIDILEGFAFFDRSVDCRLPGCMSNEVNRHFHCIRPNCNYSFVRYSTMSQHNEKHHLAENEGVENNGVATVNSNAKKSPVHIKTECLSPQSTSPSMTISEPRTPIPGKPTVIKATGTYYPLSAFPQAMGNKDGSKQSPQLSSMSGDSEASSRIPGAPDQDSNCGKLSAEWQVLLESHVAYGVERSCGRAFCKLRNRDHVHCTFCNQAYGKLMQLQRHIQKHMGSASPTGNSSRMTNSEDDLSDRLDEDDDGGSEGRRREEETSNDSNASSNPFTAHPRSSPSTDSTPSSQHLSYSATFLATSAASHSSSDVHQTFPSGSCLPGASAMNFMLPGGAAEDHRFSPTHRNGSSGADLDPEHSPRDSMPESGIPSPIDSLESDPSSPHLAGNLKRPVPTQMGSMRFEDGPESKKSKMSCLRILKDEPVPEGYVRYRFNEDCQYTHCGYREHQTHFHCMRIDCGYSFCDKTRFVQHTARHERLDTLMGGDFQQFRANVSCGRPGCIYTVTPGSVTNKASHFHCYKCEFVCTDTNKVVAHRRQHQKLDTIMAAGFEKFTASQSCNTESCSHNQRQTHYHCLKCQYAVLGLSQMSAHKYRHLE